MINYLVYLRPDNISILLQLGNDIKDFCLINKWDPAQALEDHVIELKEVKIVIKTFLFYNKPSHKLDI